MKRKLINLVLWILLMVPLGPCLHAQMSSVDIGTGSLSSHILPFNSYYKNSYNQMVYYQDEVGEAGYIGAITYQKNGTAGRVFQELTIWMAHTVDSVMTESSWVPADSLRQVYHAMDYVMPSSSGDLMIVLDSAFYYDGVRNLVIVVSRKDNAYNQNIRFNYTETDCNSCVYRCSDIYSEYGDYPGINMGTVSNRRPNVSLLKNTISSFCFPVSGLLVTEVTESSISFEWDEMDNVNGYEVAIMDTFSEGVDMDNAIPISTMTREYVFDELNASTAYIIGVRQNCGDGLYSEWTTHIVRTTEIPASMPFMCDFEVEESRILWTLQNGDFENRWVIDTGGYIGGYVGGGYNYSMYITNDTLHTYEYTILGSQGTVFAKCLLGIDEAGEYNISYDWYCEGESNYDYMRVALVPSSSIDRVEPSEYIPSWYTNGTFPNDFIVMDRGTPMSVSGGWQTYRNVVEIPNIGNYYLLLMWRNDLNGGNNPPASIDNIVVERALCSSVDSVVVTNITSTSVVINGYSESGSDFMLYYKKWGTDEYDTLLITSPYYLDNLLPGTSYCGELRTSCGADGDSYITVPFEFGTACENITLPWTFGAECEFIKKSGTSGYYPYCWNLVNGMYRYNYWMKTGGVNAHTGEQALYFEGSSSVSTIHDDWLITPMITFTGSEEMSFWVKTTTSATSSNYYGRFGIYASTDSVIDMLDIANYERLMITGDSVENYRVNFVGNEWQHITIQLPSTLVGDHHLAFVVKDTNSYSFSMDDIYLYTVSSCAMPDSLRMTMVSSNSATVTWDGNAASYVVYYGEPGYVMRMSDSVVVSATTAELLGLEPNTGYEIRVKAISEEGVESACSHPLYVTTTCMPIMNEALPFVEDFSDNEVGDMYPLDDCWYKGTNNEYQPYPYVVSSIDDGNPNSLYFYSDVTSYCYVALPAFEEAFSDLILSCSIRRYPAESYNSDMILGVMSNPYDINTFTAYDTLSPEGLGEWNNFQRVLSDFDEMDGLHITFLLPNGAIRYAHMDNVRVDIRGECASPLEPMVDFVEATSARVSWTDTIANQWVVCYGAPGFDIDTVNNLIYVDGVSEVEIMGLMPQTLYEFRVVSDCGGGNYSLPSIPMQFETRCMPIDSLPYVEDFESYTSGASWPIDECWYKSAIGTTTAYPYPYRYAAINGYMGLYLRAYESSLAKYNSYVVLPKFVEPIENLRVQFNMQSETYVSATDPKITKVAVGVMENPQDIYTFDTLAIIDMSGYANGTVRLQEVLFNTYVGEGEYIALLALDVDRNSYNTVDNVIYIDDVVVSRIPTCYRPTEFVATMDSTTADLTWNGNANAYEVVYSTRADMGDSMVIVTDTNSVVLSGLDDYTYYYINVRGICGERDTSDWMIMPERVRTLLDCGEGHQQFVDTIGTALTKSVSNTINGCATCSNTCTWMLYRSSELADLGLVSHDNMIQSISVQVGTAGTPLPIRVYMAEIEAEEILSDEDTMALNQMTLVYDGVVDFEPNSWNEMVLDTSFLYSDTMNLMIAFERDDTINFSTYFYYSSYADYVTAQVYTDLSNGYVCRYRNKYRANMSFNVCGEVPSCVRPQGVECSNITSNSVDLEWVGTADSYQIVYSNEDIDPNTVSATDMMTVNGNSATIQNLESNKAYYIYLRSVCGAEQSIWTRTIEIQTSCAPRALPYREDFDVYEAGTTVVAGQIIDSCWVKGTNNTLAYPHLTTMYSYSGDNSLKFNGSSTYYSYAVLPMFTDSIDDLMVSFKLYKRSAAHGSLHVGVVENPYDISTFHKIMKVQPSEVEIWEHFEVSLASYTGSGRYIAFLMPDSISADAYLDDVEVYVIPTCPSPINVEVPAETITSTSAVVQWTDRTEVLPTNGYELEYGPIGFELGTGTRIQSSTNPMTISGLEVGKCYEVYVRAMCSMEDVGRWSLGTAFCADCGPISLPVVYDFNSYEPIQSVIPYCFNRYNDATSANYKNNPYINGPNAVMSSRYLHFYMNSAPSFPEHAAMIFPEIDTIAHPMNGNQLIFSCKSRGTSGTMYVGLATDSLDYDLFTIVDTVEVDNEYRQYIVTFENYDGVGTFPFIAAEKGTSTNSYHVDDVIIEEILSCPRVYDLEVVNTTANTATVGWTDTIGSVQWLLEYSEEGSAIVNSIVVTENPYTITGLTSVTKYMFNVRAICSSGDTTSGVIRAGSFRTTQLPGTIPYHYDFENADEWNHWQTESNCDVNWFRGYAIANQGTYSMYVSSDDGETAVIDESTTMNVMAYRDIDFGSDTSSFTLLFNACEGGGESGMYDGISVLLVDPSAEVNALNSQYTTPWGNLSDVAIYTLCCDTNWNRYIVHLENIAGVKRVVFYWSDESMNGEKLAAIDDISIVEQTCKRPYNLGVSEIEANMATLNWSGDALNYEVAYRGEEDSVFISCLVNGNSVVIQNLVPLTNYVYKVRAICSILDTSYWSDESYFSTICARYVASDTIREDFSSTPDFPFNSTDGVMPDCWESYSNGSNGVKPHVVGSGSYWYAHDDQSLVMTSGAGGYSYTSMVRLPYIEEPINTLVMSFWMCTESSAMGSLDVGYLVGDDWEHDFVAVKTIAASMETLNSGTGNQAEGVGLYDTVNFLDVPDSAQVLAFRWNCDIAYYSVCLDDIVVYSETVCPAPNITSMMVDNLNVTLNWSGTAPDYQLLYKPAGVDVWSDTINVNTNTYTLNNLQPQTEYDVRLRALCGLDEGGNSIWIDTMFVTGDMICDRPNLSVSDIAGHSVTCTWQVGENYIGSRIHIYNNMMDTILDVVVSTYEILNLYPATEYNISVQNQCSQSVYSEWSDTIAVTTLDCLPVFDVTISDVTPNSARVSWAHEMDQSEWEINYGVSGFDLEDGITVAVTENSYEMIGLQPETQYDVYVRVKCGEDFYSIWSGVTQFNTEVVPVCNPVTNVVVDDITETSAMVRWMADDGQNKWEVNYGVRGFDLAGGTSVNVTTTNYTIDGLQNDSEYDVYVRAICESDELVSEWSDVVEFATLPSSEGIDGVKGDFRCTIYPNPTSGVTIISLQGVEGEFTINIVDMNGRIIISEVISCGIDCEKRLDVDGLSQGAYFVRIVGDDVNSVRKLIVR